MLIYLFLLVLSITGTPINRLPIMAKQVLDLYELYNLVVGRGGLVEVINKKHCSKVIINGLSINGNRETFSAETDVQV